MPRFIPMLKKTVGVSSLGPISAQVDARTTRKKFALKAGLIRRFTKRGQSVESTSSTLVNSASAQSAPTVYGTVPTVPSAGVNVYGVLDEVHPTRKQSSNTGQSAAEERPNKERLAKTKEALSAILDVLLLGVDGVAAASDVFPPAKSAAGGLKHIIDVYRNVQGVKEDDRRFLSRVEGLGELLGDTFKDATNLPLWLEKAVIDLDCMLVEASENTRERLEKNFLFRLVRLRRHVGRRQNAREDVDNALQSFIFMIQCQEAQHTLKGLARIESLASESLKVQTVSTDKYPLAEIDAKSSSLLKNLTLIGFFFAYPCPDLDTSEEGSAPAYYYYTEPAALSK